MVGGINNNFYKHGFASHGSERHPLFKRWISMHRRVSPNNTEKRLDYSDRGITVCNEWQEFLPFYEWATTNGYSPELQLDRVDNDGPYSPENCRWVTAEANTNNRRSSRLIEAFGETKSIAQWSRDARTSVHKDTIRYRLDRGWDPESAISEPRTK